MMKEDTRQVWLKSILLKYGRRIFDRCAYFYGRLCALPRNTRRRLQMAAGTGLTTFAIALALSSAPAVQAATITVDGTCTLADAITAANTNMIVNNCLGDAAGADTIELVVDVTLTTALPAISTEVTINGNGHTIMRDVGAADFRILTVAGGGNLTLNEAVITGGIASGAIPNNYGGGIFSDGVLTINNSTVSGNTAYLGGGVANRGYGAMTVYNSTLSDNSATAAGGAISSGGFEIATIANSTLTANNAIAQGGGGIFVNGGTLRLERSIISGNSANMASNTDELYILGGVIADNYNVIGYGGDDRSNFMPGISDVVPTGALNTVLFGTLGNYGGSTPTHPLVPGSDAIDIVPFTDPDCNPGFTVDQRGAVRAGGSNRGGGACDAGAFEAASFETPSAVVIRGSGAETDGSVTGVAPVLSALMLTAGTAWAMLRRKQVQIE